MGTIKAKPGFSYKRRMDCDDAVWLIWSNKWGCWYRDKSAGYTSDIAQAGLYTKDEAARHYDGPATPRTHRDTEPFPITAVRRHVEIARRQLDTEYREKIARLDKIAASLATPKIERKDDE